MALKIWMFSVIVIISFKANLDAANGRIDHIKRNFPLWDSEWVIANDINPRIYPSVLPFAPKTVVRVNFNRERIEIRFANLNHRDYWGTADAIDDVLQSFRDSVIYVPVDSIGINKDSGIDILHQRFNDTLWSLDSAINLLFSAGFDDCIIMQGTHADTLRRGDIQNRIRNRTGYSQEKPIAWMRVAKPYYSNAHGFTYKVPKQPIELRGSDTLFYYYRQKQVEISDTVIDGMTVSSRGAMAVSGYEDEITEYCDDDHCYRKVTDYSHATDNLSYWQVHVYPRVWFYPRNPDNGRPIIRDSLKVGFTEAQDKKKQSFDENSNTPEWRNPYYSDSAGTVISFAFIGASGDNLPFQNRIWLNSADIEGETKITFAHTPNKMFNWGRLGERSLYMLYSRSQQEEGLAMTLDDRCGFGWRDTDRRNGEEIFPLALRRNGILERDLSVNDGVFMYDDCPCARDSELGGQTKVEARKYIYRPIPTCNYEDMWRAYNIYSTIAGKLTAAMDASIIAHKQNELSKVMGGRWELYREIIRQQHGISNINDYTVDRVYRDNFKLRERGCPPSWTVGTNIPSAR